MPRSHPGSTRRSAALCSSFVVLACASPGVAAIESRQATRTTTPRSAPTQHDSGTGALSVRYLGNEGFLVELRGAKLLIDALHGDGMSGYVSLPPGPRSELESAAFPFDDVVVALATHHHSDHFDARAVAKFLSASATSLFVSTEQAVQLVFREADGRKELTSLRAAGDEEREPAADAPASYFGNSQGLPGLTRELRGLGPEVFVFSDPMELRGFPLIRPEPAAAPNTAR